MAVFVLGENMVVHEKSVLSGMWTLLKVGCKF